jgi:hypothetical protein
MIGTRRVRTRIAIICAAEFFSAEMIDKLHHMCYFLNQRAFLFNDSTRCSANQSSSGWPPHHPVFLARESAVR